MAVRTLAPSPRGLLKTAPRLSLVVLPFENLSGDPEQDYFADGITDDLTTDLSHLSGSFVIARNTAFTYKGKSVDAKQIGRELGVRYVLEGSVRRVGEKITVNAQLISTETGAHVWADRFDGERSKLGQLQVEFVARLANSLDVELVRAEALRAMRERPNNPDAVDLSMRGWAERVSTVLQGNARRRRRSFRARARNRPPACPGDGRPRLTLVDRATLLRSDDPKSDIARAEDWAERAVVAEPGNSAAHMAKARYFCDKRQWPQAIAEAEAAIADNPNYAKPMPNAVSGSCISAEPRMASRGSKPRFVSVLAIRMSPFGNQRFASSTIIWRNGNRRSNGARRRARAPLGFWTRSSISPPPTPGPATTRRPRRPRRNCRKSIPASPCRHLRAST